MLTVDTLPTFLLDVGLLSARDILDGDLEVTTRSRRNRNLRVTTTTGGSYLVKQPEDLAGPGAETLRREASFYAFCREAGAAAPLRALLPRTALADPARGLLALEFIQGALPLWSHYEKLTAAHFPAGVAHALGHALAAVHRAFVAPGVLDDPRLAFLPRDLPWAFTVHQPSPSVRAHASVAALEVVRLVQTTPALAAGMDAARAGWRAETLVHGDIKLDNVLVHQDAPGDEARVALVDWELVQAGDPAWDVAGALHDFLVWWIVTMPQADTVDEMAARARFPLAVLQPGMAALWRGYRGPRPRPAGEAAGLLSRAVRYAAVRLVQTAYEMAGNVPQIPAPSVLALQLAENVMADPDEARRSLFAIADAEVES